jgi:hypothetical protein
MTHQAGPLATCEPRQTMQQQRELHTCRSHVPLRVYYVLYNAIFFSFGATAPSGPGPPHSRCFKVTHIDSPQSVGLLWTSDQLVAHTSTWQHTTLTTYRHASREIRTHNLSRRAAADLPLRPRGHWDRQNTITIIKKIPVRDLGIGSTCRNRANI